ncbi:bifunctional UDP-sugar hydrolase/5'-nucleotidase [Neobacillus niacini]|uniref:bifunctional metallophosphatase/5'-nucleotidase n=1 Tax=Neobacillus niacini TaxID=86668 RepID=UPI002854C49E|nr:bifunctional UDP-sugar hydrolase/5'-nucleotidase [Neobacillus niacini]MDR6999567.1 2',3'-cyclic-nucleotide 2'-phosphodiesterase (5'-nucleotidase family) [Neobacillus niacini]
MEVIQIYHTNDIHSHFEHWPRIEKFLLTQKELHQERGDEVFLFDIGDFIDRWHPFSEGTKGKGNIELLNDCGYDAVTIGNNEGINLPFEDLDHLYDGARFDVLLANLYKAGNTPPDWIQPYKIYQTKMGTRIGVVGLTAPFTHLYELLGWELTDPVAELKKWLKTLNEKSDLIILLSHLGLDVDERIAANFPEINVILGGHTHHILQEGKQIGDTLLAAAGKYGNFVGQVSLTIHPDKKIKTKQAILFPFETLSEVKNEQRKIEEFLSEGKELLKENITFLKEPLKANPFEETKLSRILCESLREWCEADCAFINAGLLLGPLSEEVTANDLLAICPHPINPCKVELTGRELQEVLEKTTDPEWPERKIIGLGFRGTVMGVMVYEGVVFKEGDIFMNGEKLDFEKNYSLALPDMFTFGHFFSENFKSKPKKYYLPEFLRDLLKWKLQMNA